MYFLKSTDKYIKQQKIGFIGSGNVFVEPENYSIKENIKNFPEKISDLTDKHKRMLLSDLLLFLRVDLKDLVEVTDERTDEDQDSLVNEDVDVNEDVENVNSVYKKFWSSGGELKELSLEEKILLVNTMLGKYEKSIVSGITGVSKKFMEKTCVMKFNDYYKRETEVFVLPDKKILNENGEIWQPEILDEKYSDYELVKVLGDFFILNIKLKNNKSVNFLFRSGRVSELVGNKSGLEKYQIADKAVERIKLLYSDKKIENLHFCNWASQKMNDGTTVSIDLETGNMLTLFDYKKTDNYQALAREKNANLEILQLDNFNGNSLDRDLKSGKSIYIRGKKGLLVENNGDKKTIFKYVYLNVGNYNFLKPLKNSDHIKIFDTNSANVYKSDNWTDLLYVYEKCRGGEIIFVDQDLKETNLEVGNLQKFIYEIYNTSSDHKFVYLVASPDKGNLALNMELGNKNLVVDLVDEYGNLDKGFLEVQNSKIIDVSQKMVFYNLGWQSGFDGKLSKRAKDILFSDYFVSGSIFSSYQNLLDLMVKKLYPEQIKNINDLAKTCFCEISETPIYNKLDFLKPLGINNDFTLPRNLITDKKFIKQFETIDGTSKIYETDPFVFVRDSFAEKSKYPEIEKKIGDIKKYWDQKDVAKQKYDIIEMMSHANGIQKHFRKIENPKEHYKNWKLDDLKLENNSYPERNFSVEQQSKYFDSFFQISDREFLLKEWAKCKASSYAFFMNDTQKREALFANQELSLEDKIWFVSKILERKGWYMNIEFTNEVSQQIFPLMTKYFSFEQIEQMCLEFFDLEVSFGENLFVTSGFSNWIQIDNLIDYLEKEKQKSFLPTILGKFNGYRYEHNKKLQDYIMERIDNWPDDERLNVVEKLIPQLSEDMMKLILNDDKLPKYKEICWLAYMPSEMGYTEFCEKFVPNLDKFPALVQNLKFFGSEKKENYPKLWANILEKVDGKNLLSSMLELGKLYNCSPGGDGLKALFTQEPQKVSRFLKELDDKEIISIHNDKDLKFMIELFKGDISEQVFEDQDFDGGWNSFLQKYLDKLGNEIWLDDYMIKKMGERSAPLELPDQEIIDEELKTLIESEEPAKYTNVYGDVFYFLSSGLVFDPLRKLVFVPNAFVYYLQIKNKLDAAEKNEDLNKPMANGKAQGIICDIDLEGKLIEQNDKNEIMAVLTKYVYLKPYDIEIYYDGRTLPDTFDHKIRYLLAMVHRSQKSKSKDKDENKHFEEWVFGCVNDTNLTDEQKVYIFQMYRTVIVQHDDRSGYDSQYFSNTDKLKLKFILLNLKLISFDENSDFLNLDRGKLPEFLPWTEKKILTVFGDDDIRLESFLEHYKGDYAGMFDMLLGSCRVSEKAIQNREKVFNLGDKFRPIFMKVIKEWGYGFFKAFDGFYDMEIEKQLKILAWLDKNVFSGTPSMDIPELEQKIKETGYQWILAEMK